MPKLFIQASNIHTGGGLTLLNQLIQDINFKAELFVDERSKNHIHVNKNINIHFIKKNIFSRWFVEVKMLCLVSKGDTILFFNNLPPFIKTRAFHILYLQNILLIHPYNLKKFSLLARWRIRFERLYLKIFISNVDSIYVQSSEMLSLCKQKFSTPSFLMPFFLSNQIELSKVNSKKLFDFVYVSSSDPHKNHTRILDAFVLLAKEGFFPSICFTIDSATDKKLTDEIDILKTKYSLRIEYKKFNNLDSKENLYSSSKALLFASELESMGLPLIEANSYGLDILVSEKGFSRDFSSPIETFDPSSSLSIARAIKRYLFNIDDRLELKTPYQFLQQIFLEK
ncbi:glycosyltransferase [Gammaproteobacteria bacterium]|nr:glycosyltransferase [Gammaproteobacteria bacterium]